jgi:hypothetical protein
MWLRLTCFAALALTLCGCSPFPSLYPVTGTVNYNGKPVTSGGLIFESEPGKSGGFIVNAGIKADGTFSAETSRVTGNGTEILPGVPNGRYTIIYHPDTNGENAGPGATLSDTLVVDGKPVMLDLVIPPAKPKDEPKLKEKKD